MIINFTGQMTVLIRMIQQIAFLLGEEVSENTKTIDSVIRALRVTATNPDAR